VHAYHHSDALTADVRPTKLYLEITRLQCVCTHVLTLHTCKVHILTQGSARSATEVSHTHAKNYSART
jgi:hypothetical protein